MKSKDTLPIAHSKLIDGFAQLKEYTHYLPFASFCGLCDVEIWVSAAVQQHLLETKRVPVKMLMRGAVFCEGCTQRRARINFLRKNDHYHTIENGLAELNRLLHEEREKSSSSAHRYHLAVWPYD
jgi:hypothetical protein